MKRWSAIFVLILCVAVSFAQENRTEGGAQAAAVHADHTSQEFDMAEYLFGHIMDSYEWHITAIGGRHISIPLPVIVFGRTNGPAVFLSSRLRHGNEYKGYFIARDGHNKDRIVERNAAGEEIVPFDISITKNVLALMISSALLVWLVLSCARWYRRHDVLHEAPSGIAAVLEPVIVMIDEEVIKPSVGKQHARFSPYLLTAFFFILINNLMGIVPFFPGGANVTGNIAVTFVLALFTFLMVNLFGNRHYFKEIFWPDVPVFLKAIPIMPAIEFIGLFTKPFSLMIRLFANIMAGHILILSVIGMIFITASMGPVLNGSLSLAAVLFGVFMDCLEIMVAFIQAYVFTMLSSVFIGMAHPHEDQ